ncbi:MAG: Uma2 family endonuclease [Solirubrobacterales bacterium]|nr:Uma2 family endonuclease [Solirubrobacterales bacterium]
MNAVQILINDPPPDTIREALEARQRAGVLDEVWDGVVHLSPDANRAHSDILQQLAERLLSPLARARGLVPSIQPFNLGAGKNDYRIPDGGIFQERSSADWNLTAELVIEVVSPGDESWNKFDFFAAHSVDEVLIIDPYKRSVDWFGLRGDRYEPIEQSGVIDLSRAALAQQIDWPVIEDQ